MDIKQAIRSVLKEMIVPEIAHMKQQNQELKIGLDMTNKRLDDFNIHLANQSNRIDKIREELSSQIRETNKRIDETNKRIDETNKRIDETREDLGNQIRETNKRVDRLYEVVVKREEHYTLEMKLIKLEEEIQKIKEKIAA